MNPLPHLTPQELVDHYYGESSSRDAAHHLAQCPDCAASYADLSQTLSAITPLETPERDIDYGLQVWDSIRGSLRVYDAPAKKSNWFSLAALTGPWRGLAAAAACLLVIAAAFFAGRAWENRAHPPAVAGNHSNGASNTAADQGRERVVLLVLGDHLDRSERLLVQLRHAEPAAEAPLQAEARDLLAANRLYRESVKQSDDPTLAAALDHLERVLIEVSNEPGGLTQARLDELQKEMNTDGLLFEVRVLRSRVQSDVQESTEPKQARPSATKGVSI